MTHNSATPFSLPSASGVVSLLNDQAISDKQTAVGSPAPKYLYASRRKSSTATSTEVSKSPSPFSHSRGTGDGFSRTSFSSTDASSGASSNESSVDFSKNSKDLKSRFTLNGGEIRQPEYVDSSASSNDGKEDATTRGAPSKRKRDDKAEDSHILAHSRFARSPGAIGSEERAGESGNAVPLSMQRAADTSRPSERNTSEEDDKNQPSHTFDSKGSRADNQNSKSTSGKRRYPCTFPGCGKTFSTSGHAARHNRIHTGMKPYRCTFPGCSASFSRQDNSLQHYRTHVLHPKGRSGTTIDGSGMDAAQFDNELQNLDAETIASVQMGRKALEEGTAIAVVQEFVDGNGRRGEAVQRMVGQPRSSRRGTITDTLLSRSNTYTDHRRYSLDNAPTAFERGLPRHEYGYGATNVSMPSVTHPNGDYRTFGKLSSTSQVASHLNHKVSLPVYPYSASAYISRNPGFDLRHHPDHLQGHGSGTAEFHGSSQGLQTPHNWHGDAPYKYGEYRRASLMDSSPSTAAMDCVSTQRRSPHGAGHRRVMSNNVPSSSADDMRLSDEHSATNRGSWPSRRVKKEAAQEQGGLSLLLTAATTPALRGTPTPSPSGQDRPSGLPSEKERSPAPRADSKTALVTSPRLVSPLGNNRKTDLRLPFPAASKLPFSTDRTTATAGVTTPTEVRRSDQASTSPIPMRAPEERNERGEGEHDEVKLPPLRTVMGAR